MSSQGNLKTYTMILINNKAIRIKIIEINSLTKFSLFNICNI
jgi:hypothetical protein